MSEIHTTDDINEMEEGKVYEIGFHIVPSISEEDSKGEFEGVKKIIQGQDGSSFISEGLPSLKTLAYSISKTVKAIKTSYSKAYFGWVKFTARPEQVAEIKRAVDEMPTIIRYLIISTVHENTMISKQDAVDGSEEDENDEGAPVIAEDIDKTIDQLVVQ